MIVLPLRHSERLHLLGMPSSIGLDAMLDTKYFGPYDRAHAT